MSPAARRSLRDEGGLTLIEIIIAGFVLSVAVLGLASVASASLVSIRDSRERDRATTAASSAIEAIRALDYDDIAMPGTAWQSDPLVSAGTVTGTWQIDVDGDGTYERIVTSPAGEIVPYLCTSGSACWFEMPEGTRLEVRTFVTWYQTGSDPQSAKRVTSVATWDDPSFPAPRRAQMSTVVARADRGLPAPAFDVLPASLQTSLDQAWVEGGEEQMHCFVHTITNSGSPDNYEIKLDDDPSGEAWIADAPLTEGTWKNEHWVFRAYFVPSGEEPNAQTLMLADGDTGFNLISPSGLETGESAQIHLCYSPREGSDGEPKPSPATNPPTAGTSPYAYAPSVRSRFDPEVTTSVDHRIKVVDEVFDLFLHYGLYHYDVNEWEHFLGGTYTRPARARVDGVFSFLELPMMPGAPPPKNLPHFDPYIRHADINYAHSPDRLNIGGMFLPPGPVTVDEVSHPRDAFAIEWDWQFDDDTAPVTFTGQATVDLWGRRTQVSGEAPPPQSLWCLTAELLKFPILPNNSLSTTPELLSTKSLEKSVAGGWTKLDQFDLPLASGTSFAPGDVLRLRIVNTGSTEQEGMICVRLHVGFGAQDFPAKLRLVPGS